MNYYTGNFPKKQTKNTGRGILRALPALLAAALLIGGVLFSFFFLLAAGGCAAEELSSLRSFSGTHAGVYECEEATLNGTDLLETYREITLELREDGTFCVIASPAGENALHADGVYAFDETGGILFRLELNRPGLFARVRNNFGGPGFGFLDAFLVDLIQQALKFFRHFLLV